MFVTRVSTSWKSSSLFTQFIYDEYFSSLPPSFDSHLFLPPIPLFSLIFSHLLLGISFNLLPISFISIWFSFLWFSVHTGQPRQSISISNLYYLYFQYSLKIPIPTFWESLIGPTWIRHDQADVSRCLGEGATRIVF